MLRIAFLPLMKPFQFFTLLGFCGFRPYPEICRFLKDVPELRQIVTEGLAEAFCQAVDNGSHAQIQRFALKACFSSIYDREEALVKVAVKEMIARLKKTLGAPLVILTLACLKDLRV